MVHTHHGHGAAQLAGDRQGCTHPEAEYIPQDERLEWLIWLELERRQDLRHRFHLLEGAQQFEIEVLEPLAVRCGHRRSSSAYDMRDDHRRAPGLWQSFASQLLLLRLGVPHQNPFSVNSLRAVRMTSSTSSTFLPTVGFALWMSSFVWSGPCRARSPIPSTPLRKEFRGVVSSDAMAVHLLVAPSGDSLNKGTATHRIPHRLVTSIYTFY